jgi:hypothetical protein
METIKKKPGPNADAAFRLGMLAAAVVMLVTVGSLYAFGHLTVAQFGYTVVLLFPVYLVFAASALSVWLGFDKDATDLQPVSRQRDQS